MTDNHVEEGGMDGVKDDNQNDSSCATQLFSKSARPKSLLPVHGKPIIYHPLSLLLLAGIRRILIIAPPSDIPHFQRCLGGGAQWGIRLSYAVQSPPARALPALLIAAEFIGDQSVLLVPRSHVHDYVFYGQSLPAIMQNVAPRKKGAQIFIHRTNHRQHPATSSATQYSEDAPACLYLYDNSVSKRARKLESSAPGECTLADMNDTYRAQGTLTMEEFGDCEKSPDDKYPNIRTGCPEEAARRMGFIDDQTARNTAHNLTDAAIT